MSWVSALSDWLLAIFGSAFTLIGGFVARTDLRSRSNRQDLDKMKRQLHGDDDDPNTPGIFEIVHTLDEKVECLDEKFDDHRRESKKEHREVLSKVEELADD